jgi:predicted molibdopterin-dependent oxidoreductase YjgC
MGDTIIVRVNGKPVSVPKGSTVAIAVLIAGATSRISVAGEPRAPFCGTGSCFECRVAIDGRLHRRGCQVLCEAEMEITSNG